MISSDDLTNERVNVNYIKAKGGTAAQYNRTIKL
ncbi:hypothetical protein J2S74_000486 [Evansella vedderi]|uniref:Uncharacterized protein n=1 Tax=Evansella vedderi TaxID=38282 RepID=A0ABT9ZPI7_9BACI|nr:hypothetical protein [Evansella vedderi]